MKSARFCRIAAVLGVLAILGTAGVAAANPVYHYSSGYLGQEQMSKAQELINAHRAAVIPLEQQLNAKQAELNALLYSATPDKAKIEEISRDIGAIQGQIYASEATLNAQLAKEGIPANGCPGSQYMAHGRGGCGGGYSGGYGGRGGYGGGHGGRHGGWHW